MTTIRAHPPMNSRVGHIRKSAVAVMARMNTLTERIGECKPCEVRWVIPVAIKIDIDRVRIV